MSDDAKYVNDVLPEPKFIEIQGKKIPVDPLKFSVKDEITIRQAFSDEMTVFEDESVPWWKKALESRKIILGAGEFVIPRVCTGWTTERVDEELSHESIGAVLNFFLRADWRNPVLVEEGTNLPTPVSVMTIPSAPKPSKKKADQ